MTIVEFLQKAQYSRISVGHRWLYASSNGFDVMEKKPNKRHSTKLADNVSEEEAVRLLIEGEPLYSDLL